MNNFAFVIFLLGFGPPIVVLGLVYLFRRWPLQKRRVVALVFYALGTIGMGIFCFSLAKKPGSTAAAAIFLIFWLFATGLGIWEWRRLGRAVARNPAIARRPLKTEPFFWQGVLILVPVAVMGVLAAAAVIKDRSAAEQEMRQKAESLLEQINRDFEAKFDKHRFNYEWVTHDAGALDLDNKLFPPGDIFHSETVASPIMEEWRPDVPDALVTEEGVRFCPVFNADGGMRPRYISNPLAPMRPGNEPPEPPQWRTELTTEQQAAWENLCRAIAGSNNLAKVRETVQKFKKTGPSVDAIQNAEFSEERAVLEAQPTPATVRAMFHTRSAASESGIPLSSLGVAEALKRADEFTDARALRELWDQVALDARNKPNLLTPTLVELAEPLAQRSPPLKECLAALKSRWRLLEDMWAVGELIQGSGKLRGVTATNFWLEFKGQPWFCILEPETEKWGDGQGKLTTNTCTKARLFSRAAVTWAFHRAFEDTQVTIPRYFELTGELAGSQPIRLSAASSVTRDLGSVLAQIEGRDKFMGDAQYVLRVHVADARLMLSAQRQRAMMIGGLLAMSVVAAFVGFISAKRAFDRQLRLNEMKSDFVSSVSHELRAPIASVRLMAEGLERGKIQGAEKQNEYFRFIVQECRRLSSLIENVLDFSRIEQGRKQYEMESTNLVALTEQTVKLMGTYAEERQVRIEMQVKGEAAPVEVEGKAIQQALVNLIDNAIKHSPKGAGIMVGLDFEADKISSVEARPQPPGRSGLWAGPGIAEDDLGMRLSRSPSPRPLPKEREKRRPMAVSLVALWVEDQGEGIAAVEQERIFERFYRVGSELRRETQGVGIGLSIVKHIVEAHGGKVTVRSAPGEGSRFTIELPVSERESRS